MQKLDLFDSEKGSGEESDNKVRQKNADVNPEKNKWLYYTRNSLMSKYRDNLYRMYYNLSALLSLRGEKNEKSLGISLKLMDTENKKEMRINDLENFLLSVLKGSEQIIDENTYTVELEDFSASDAFLIKFLDSIFDEGSYIYESGKIWLKNHKAKECFDILKDHASVRYDNKALIYHDEILEVLIKGEKNTKGDLVFKAVFSNESIDEKNVFTFGSECPYIISRSSLYYTNPSYPKLKKTLFKEDIVIDEKYISDFCARVLPALKKDFVLDIPYDIGESDEKAYPASPIVYLDYDGKSILAAIKFKYGKYTVDPYTNMPSGTNDPSLKLYRDTEKENYFCEILSKCLQRDGNFAFSTVDDEKIFVFCYKKLPSLQEKGWTFFYSEAFRSLKINVKPPKMQVSISKGINFFEVNFSLEGVDELSDISSLASVIKNTNKEYIRLQNGSFIPIDIEIMDYLAKIISASGAQSENENTALLPLFSAPYFTEALEKHTGISLNIDEGAKKVLDDIQSVEYDETPPKNIKGQFRAYQMTGYRWLRKLADMGLHGILADDMGLGKSFQTIASILKEKEREAKHPSLIVCPTSCVVNWYMEIKKFAPTLEAVILNGSGKRRTKRIRSIEHYDVAIISYSTLRRDVKNLKDIMFNYVILDEAQHIKNANTQNSKTVKALVSLKRLALTGTPIENGVSEIWSLFDFLIPGFFGRHKDFSTLYEVPIVSEGENSENALFELKKRISPFILRRLKTDVLKDLPPKHTNIAYCDPTKDQKELYLSILEAARLEIFETVKRKGFHNSRIEIFSALTRLRQVCCHPKLLSQDMRGESHTSGKFNLFIEIAREAIDGGHNIIVFSQFTKMLKIISETFKHIGIKYLYLDGATKDRMDLVNRFNSGEAPVFLLSLKAAGTGLTLTKADTVIHFDMWWNPAVEDQATDRAYRIGQKRVVTNYKLVTRGTIEEKILALQEKKRGLIASIIDGEVGSASKNINWEEVKSLIE